MVAPHPAAWDRDVCEGEDLLTSASDILARLTAADCVLDAWYYNYMKLRCVINSELQLISDGFPSLGSRGNF